MNLSRIISYQNAKEQYLLELLIREIHKSPTTVKALLKEEPWFNLLNKDPFLELLETIEDIKQQTKSQTKESVDHTYDISQEQNNTIEQLDQNLDKDSSELIASLSKTGIKELTQALLAKHEPTKPDKIIKNIFKQTALSSSEQEQAHIQKCDLMRELLLNTIALKHRKDWRPNNPKTSIIKNTQKAINNGKGEAAKFLINQASSAPKQNPS